jgi:hypothetical protein
MADDSHEQRISTLEAKVHELEALVNVALRLLAVEKPISAVLERYGATEAEDMAIHALLDDLATRAERGGMYAPSFGGFGTDLFERFPSMRGNKESVALLLDTLKVGRPAYQKLDAYITAEGWPQWT